MGIIYDVSTGLAKLEADLLDDDQVSQEAAAAALEKWLNANRAATKRLDSFVAWLTEIQARAVARKAEAERIAHRARVDEEKAALIRSQLLAMMQRFGIRKIETQRFRVSRCQNGGKPPLIINEYADPARAEPRFQRVSIDWNREAVRAALEAGEQLPWAHIAERGEHVRIL